MKNSRKRRNMSYCKCSGANKTKGFTCRQHCKYGRPKKSRKPVRKKSRKPARKKSRKPARKKSGKSKTKFKVRKDRVFKKHGQIGAGRRLKEQKLSSLFDLAAQKLPHTSEWAEGSDPNLKHLVTKPQQKRLKRIMGSDLIKEVASRRAIIEPLSKKEIDILMEAAFNFNDIMRGRGRGQFRRAAARTGRTDEVDAVYSTLMSLREIPNNEYENNEFFRSYADRLSEAREDYIRKLILNLQEVKDDIQDVKEEVESEGRSFDFERDFTFEDEQGNMVTGSAAARAEKQFLDEMAWEKYRHSLAVAESYRNDLFNYAYAAVADYRKYGGANWLDWPLRRYDLGENNEHQYGSGRLVRTRNRRKQ